MAAASATPAALNLQPLASNGGPTQTVALGVGSAAIDRGNPATTLTTDQRGYARVFGPAPDIGAFEAQPFTVASVQVNDGSAQRSEVHSISVTFSGPVTFAGGNTAAAFQLQHVQGTTNIANLQAVTSTNASGQTVVTLSFTTTGNAASEIDPVSALNGGAASLADGRFQLTVFASDVTGPDELNLAGGSVIGNYVSPADTQGGGPGQLHLYRLFGDSDGNGIVDQVDLARFRSANNSSSISEAYIAYLDADNSGTIDQFDLAQFRQRNNANIFGPMAPTVTPAAFLGDSAPWMAPPIGSAHHFADCIARRHQNCRSVYLNGIGVRRYRCSATKSPCRPSERR